MCQLIPSANFLEGSRNLPSNTPTRSESDHPRRGFSGTTRAMQRASSRVIVKLQTKSRSLVGAIPRQTFSSWFTTGCATKRRESGSLSSTMWMMLVSFSILRGNQAAWIAEIRNRSESISLEVGMDRFSSRPGPEVRHCSL